MATCCCRPRNAQTGRVADVDRAIDDRVGHLVGQQTIEPAGDAVAASAAKALGLELREDDGPGVVGLDLGEQLRRPAAGGHQFDQRRLMAHAHAADPLDHRRAALRPACGGSFVDLSASQGHAARAHADADLGHRAVGRPPPSAGRPWGPAQKIVDHLGDAVRGETAVGDAVDLDHRGQRAAAEAGHLLDREQPFGSVSPPGDPEVPLQGVLDQLGALHVAGRAVADADDVLADRLVAELRVEGGHALDRRRRDLGQPAHPLQGLAGQIAIVRLDRLEDRDHRLGATSQPLDGLVDELEIAVVHSHAGWVNDRGGPGCIVSHGRRPLTEEVPG